jgi:type IV secretory pathway VirB10-like protein
MRPKIAIWSAYRPPTQKRWRTRYRRSARSSTGLKILLVAIACVAGIIGISGIYPQIIDSEWAYGTSTLTQRVADSEATPTPPRSGILAEIPLPPRRAVVTTGEAVATPPAAPPAPAARAAAAVPAPAPASSSAPSELRPSIAATEQPQAADPDAALAVADVPEAPAVADPPANPAPVATPVVGPAQRHVATAPVVKRRVVRTEHHRGYSGAYAQYGGGWGSWSGWSGQGSPYNF